MLSNPNDPLSRFRRVAQSLRANEDVPYAFESRIMSRVRSVRTVREGAFARLLWQGAMTSLCCAALSASFMFFWQSELEEDDVSSLDDSALVQVEAE